MIPAILTTVPIDGVQTEVVLVAGKMGKVFAYRADDGKPSVDALRRQAPERHRAAAAQGHRRIFPGDLGGVETPMALAAKPSLRALARLPGPRERDRPLGRPA